MFVHHDHPELHAFLDLVNNTPALREYERQVLRRHEAALADAIAGSSPGVSSVTATALARYVLGALDIARDQPDPGRAFAELMDLIRPGWPAP
jgi:hypothetical protein